MSGYEIWVVLDGGAVVGPFPDQESASKYAEGEGIDLGNVRKVIDP